MSVVPRFSPSTLPSEYFSTMGVDGALVAARPRFHAIVGHGLAGGAPRMTSLRPLFISADESMDIFAPMFHVWGARAPERA